MQYVFLWVHTYKDKNAFSFVTQQTLLILWSLISTVWHILHPQELGPSNSMNLFFFPERTQQHLKNTDPGEHHASTHFWVYFWSLSPFLFSLRSRRLLGAKPESQDLSMQLLSLNSEFATGVMQFHLNTDLLSSRHLSACTEAQGHCWDAKGRTGRNWGNRCWLWYRS